MFRKNLICAARACLALCLLFFLAIQISNAQERQTEAPKVARLVAEISDPSVASTRAKSSEASEHRRIDESPNVNPSAANLTAEMAMERKVFALINEARRAEGLAPLVWDERLCAMARAHSENMARKNFFSHTDPENGETLERARALGVRGWSAIAENIAYNQGFDDPASFAVERWLKSSVHRYNILYGAFTLSGIGVARASDGRIFFTQVFLAR